MQIPEGYVLVPKFLTDDVIEQVCYLMYDDFTAEETQANHEKRMEVAFNYDRFLTLATESKKT